MARTDTSQTAPFLQRYVMEAVPRYTSYPPATRFHDGVGEADWASWMDGQTTRPVLSLYVHIPFCKTMCWYCGCNTTVPNKDDRIARYLDALDAEIANRPVPADGIVNHIHFGGGSPDMLSPERFGRIMDAFRARFEITANAEIAVELDPRGVTEELAAALAQAGVTRASLGVQDLSPEVQNLIHRIQPAETVARAAMRLRRAGIHAINMDIMYGLPAQTVERVEATARAVADMGADRVSVFGYAHVPWFKKHQRAIPEDRLPGARERFDQMQAASACLKESGYDAIGFDHFARPDDSLARAARAGRLRRNFQGYTDDPYDVLIGYGASSISEARQGYIQNLTDPARYAAAIEAGEPVLVRGLTRTEEECETGARIARLLCDFQVEAGADGFDPDALADMMADGLVEVDGDMLRVTHAGRSYVRNIAARIDPAFQAAANQHSQAV
ncbi:oxygen-independent coproporphyrinogen III oxidase [Maricaulis parjimensis]|uniref:oxygen-independent coproporphyrinogen III oxidase n=1 Tax=Maricaulis parjimensis TaxID=144023 RepID=UPI00193A2ED4|nr:oxygen-independent coproporphyrinogen III oxidase [Maricaulis parjimensis]